MRQKDMPLSNTQIREFLNRLAGYEGCQYNGIEWSPRNIIVHNGQYVKSIV